MLKILAIDTALSASSVSLCIDGAVKECHEIAPKRQSELILLQVQAILDEADLKLNMLDAIALGAGPASFTGVRLAFSVAQGLCFGADLPAIPVSTLRAIAQSAYREHGTKNVIVVQNAHAKGEVYWAIYRLDTAGLMQPFVSDTACTPDAIVLPKIAVRDAWVGVGDGFQAYGDVIVPICCANGIVLDSIKCDQISRASDVARLAVSEFTKGNVLSAEKCQPNYFLEDLFKKAIS